MILGRDLVPVQVPSSLPLHARAYQAYRSSIPNIVATIDRKEKTTTPPFASTVCAVLISNAQGSFLSSRALSVSFVLTSKIPGSDYAHAFVSLVSKTWLYVRRNGEKILQPVLPEEPMEIFDGDTLSIWNECSEMAEHIGMTGCCGFLIVAAWKLSIPQSM